MKEKGFTLLELIITIVVGSIIMLGIAGYVQMGMKGFVDSASRQQVQTQAQFVLEKLSREIRHAVPYSFKVEGGCLRLTQEKVEAEALAVVQQGQQEPYCTALEELVAAIDPVVEANYFHTFRLQLVLPAP